MGGIIPFKRIVHINFDGENDQLSELYSNLREAGVEVTFHIQENFTSAVLGATDLDDVEVRLTRFHWIRTTGNGMQLAGLVTVVASKDQQIQLIGTIVAGLGFLIDTYASFELIK